MTRTLQLTALDDLPEFEPGDDVANVILRAAAAQKLSFRDGDIVAIAQKIVSKAEGRAVDLDSITPGPAALALASETRKDPRLVELILRESKEVLRAQPDLIIAEHRLGFVCANAGIDRSNVPGSDQDRVLLLPLDPDRSARVLGQAINAKTGADVGVLIIDSHGRPWRMGTVGFMIGTYRVPALLDLRGRPDRSGRTLEVTQIGLADELAAAASVLFGQADEGAPVVLIRGLPYSLQEASLDDVLRPREEDLFR